MDLLPVNINEATVVSRVEGISGLTATRPTAPKVEELSSWSQENYQLQLKAAAHLGFPVANLDGSLNNNLLIFGTSRWTDVDSGDGHVYRFGVSLRVLVEVASAEGQIGLTLPEIAANVQLRRAQASAQLVVRGYNSPELGTLLPPWQAFNVDSYSQYMSAVSAIQAKIMQDDSHVVPQLLATTLAGPTLPSSAENVGTVFALKAIVKGDNLAKCLSDNDSAAADIKDSVSQTYADFGLGANDVPTPEDRKEAADQLGPAARAQHWWSRKK